MPQVKGTAVLSSLRYVRERFGEGTLGRILAALAAEDAVLGQGLLASAWYPMATFLRFMQEAERQLAPLEPRLLQNMGRASCEEGLRGVYRIFLKVGKPQYIIDRATRVLSNYYDSGRLDVVESRNGHVVVELRLEGSARQFCERIYGWMQRTLELTGVRNLRSAHSSCVHRGDPICRFEGSWD